MANYLPFKAISFVTLGMDGVGNALGGVIILGAAPSKLRNSQLTLGGVVERGLVVVVSRHILGQCLVSCELVRSMA